MSKYDYDLFVIGAGSGGVRAARIAAGYGAKVGIAEESRVGGTCVIRGCVPKKLFSYAAHFHEDFEDARNYGWDVPDIRFDWTKLIANKDKEIDRLNGIYKNLLANSKVELIEKRAVVVDPHTIKIGDKNVTAGNILIAVGSWPDRPAIPGIEHSITSNEAFQLASLPKDIVIVGGGYIAVEFAGIFNGLGAKVALLYRGEKILRGFDEDVRDFLTNEMTKKGVIIQTKADPTRIDRSDARLNVKLNNGHQLTCDTIMYATGRKPKTNGMGLQDVGIKLKQSGAIEVNAASQTSIPNIHAIGDCTDRVNLTPVAIREGHAYADSVFGNKPWNVDHTTIASAVFSHPPVGFIGLTEAAALGEGKELDIYKAEFKPLKHTISGRDERTLMKLVVDRNSKVVLGVHMVGMDAPEILQAIAIAVKMGATKQQFDAAMAVHPTAAEEFVTMRSPVSR